MNERIEKLIAEMSVVEKALLTSGRKFWFTRGLKKYGIEPYMVTDGPHGLRKQKDTDKAVSVNDSADATCFPVACVMASTWNEELIKGVGERIADEAKQEDVGIVLGPGANIKRSPLCGRNFEYYSEDPYLSSKCAASFIKGVQSKGVGTSLKHFAVNNQETDRLRINSVVDERALREIYLASFETAVKEGKPYTLMCSYNQINGEFASENKRIMTDILRGEWGFDGYVMTDWGAVNDKIKSVKAGIDLEMPGGSGESVQDVVLAVAEGRLELETLNTAVRRLLEANFKINEAKEKGFTYDADEHHKYAEKVAAEGAVLLKNDRKVLPLDKNKPVTVIGALFKNSRFQGSGSSLIRPTKVTTPYDAFTEAGIQFNYAEGFSHISDEPDDKLIKEACELAKNTDAPVLVFAGLTLFYESEGFDRKHISLPKNQNILIERLQGLHKDITVVLYGGSPVEMPWINGVDAVLNMYLPGQAGGGAVRDILFGGVNPSGRLAETYPLKLSDTPCYSYYPEGPVTVEYRESIFVGYRYYDTAKKEVAFPFGYGLSYTSFKYSDLILGRNTISKGDGLTVECSVSNTGERTGKEVVQLYVRAKGSKIFRADKEMKGFAKIELSAGETKKVKFELNDRSFAYFNVKTNDWEVENGEYEILIGASAADIRLSGDVYFKADEVPLPYADESKIAEYYSFNGTVSDTAFQELLGNPPPSKLYVAKPVRWFTTPKENTDNFTGRMFYKILLKAMGFVNSGDDENAKLMNNFLKEMVTSNSMRAMATSNGGMLSMKMMEGLIMFFNKKRIRGICRLIKAAIGNMKYDKYLKKIEEQK